MCRNFIDRRGKIHQITKIMMQPLNLPENRRMKACRHSGQVISNDDGFNPVKILDDLHAKSVREFEDQSICPSSREGTGVRNGLPYHAGRPGVPKCQRAFRHGCLAFVGQIVFEKNSIREDRLKNESRL